MAKDKLVELTDHVRVLSALTKQSLELARMNQ